MPHVRVDTLPARSASEGRRREKYANASTTLLAYVAYTYQPEALARDEGDWNLRIHFRACSRGWWRRNLVFRDVELDDEGFCGCRGCVPC